MKVLQIFPSTIRGGAEEFSLVVATGLAEAGEAVYTAFPSRPATGSLVEDFAAGGVKVIPLEVPAGARSRSDLCRQSLRTARLLLTLRPDVVHLVLPYPDQCLGSLFACALLGVPAVVGFQLTTAQVAFDDRMLKLYAWIRGRRQSWVAISENNRDLLSRQFRVDKGDLELIYVGPCQRVSRSNPDSARIKRQIGAEGKTLILTVGRLHPQKGYDLMVKAIPAIVEKNSNVLFLWLGEGEQRAELESLIDANRIGDYVKLFGHQKDVGSFLRAADLFLLPTRYEGGSSHALLEAMQEGLPVVASRASGIPEVITDRLHGLLFDVDDVNSLAASMNWALANRAEMLEMAERSKVRVEAFSAERMIRETHALLSRRAIRD